MPTLLKSKLADKLRAAKLRPTRSRLFVLESVTANPGRWMNTDEIRQDLKIRKAQISLCTVYIAVKELQNSGLLLKECHDGLNGGRSVYLLKPETDENASDSTVCIICRKCRSSTFVQAPEVRSQLQALASCQCLDTSCQHISVLVTCDQCARAQAAGEHPARPGPSLDRSKPVLADQPKDTPQPLDGRKTPRQTQRKRMGARAPASPMPRRGHPAS